MASGPDPMVQRRRLRIELRKAREVAGLTQREVAPLMDWSMSKLIRIETGAVGITINDLKVLLQLYSVTDTGRIQELLEMAKAAREPAWWNSYKDISPSEFASFLSYESAASVIRNFEPLLMPGLLQTEEYARATLVSLEPLRAESIPQPMKQVDRLVELRMERQERLAQRSDDPKVFFAIDEAVIHRWVGGPEVMRRQLKRLRKALDDSDFTIWIAPFSAGLYQRQRGAYQIFEFPTDEDADVLYLEGTRGDLIVRDDLGETATYLEAFWLIEQAALKNHEAIQLVDRAISRLSDSPAKDSSMRETLDADVDSGQGLQQKGVTA